MNAIWFYTGHSVREACDQEAGGQTERTGCSTDKVGGCNTNCAVVLLCRSAGERSTYSEHTLMILIHTRKPIYTSVSA